MKLSISFQVFAAAVIAAACAHPGLAAASDSPVRAAFTQRPSPTRTPAATGRTPHPGMSGDAPENFDLSKFAPVTTTTLPIEDGRPIVARVNGVPVYLDEFEIQARIVGARLLQKQPDQVLGLMSALREPLLDVLKLQVLYRQFATSHTLTVSPAEVERRRASYLRFSDPAVMASVAKLSSAQTDSLVMDALLREKVDKYLGDIATSTPATAQDIARFQASGGSTTAPMEITRARHIVIRATPDMSEFNTNDAEARTSEVLEKIRGGLDFAEAARQYSQDRFSAAQGGSIGYYSAGMMYPEFEKAAAALKPGEVSGVVRTPVGFHIIQVIERHGDNTLLKVDQMRRSEAVAAWRQQAGDTARVEVYLP